MTALSVDIPKEARCCRNCACYMEVRHPQNPTEFQGFCRREPPRGQEVRVSVPRLNDKKEPMFMRDGKTPQMIEQRRMALVHQVTAREMTCFDGWRPVGTRPGDDWRHQWMAEMVKRAATEHYTGSLELVELVRAIERWQAGPEVTPPAANDATAAPEPPMPPAPAA